MESIRRLPRTRGGRGGRGAQGFVDAASKQRPANPFMDSPFNDSPTNTPRANDSAVSAGAEPLVAWSEDSASVWSQKPGMVTWIEEEVAMFAKQFHNDTIHEVHQKLFCDWIFQDSDNFALAKRYIRELSVDQNYDTSRIQSNSLRRLLDDVISLRPVYRAPVLPPKREGELSIAEMLKEDPIECAVDHRKDATKLLKGLRSVPSSLVSLGQPTVILSLRKSSSRFFPNRPGTSGKEPPAQAPQQPSSPKPTYQIVSSVPASARTRTELPTKKSISSMATTVRSRTGLPINPFLSATPTSVRAHMEPWTTRFLSTMPTPMKARTEMSMLSPKSELKIHPPAMIAPLRVRSQQYPPDTPDRPAPLNIVSRSKSTIRNEVSRSVSSPIRGRVTSPLPPRDTSPPPPMPPIPTSLRSAVRPALHTYPIQHQKKQQRTTSSPDLFVPMYKDTSARKQLFDSALLQRFSLQSSDSDWQTVSDTGDEQDEEEYCDEAKKPNHTYSLFPARQESLMHLTHHNERLDQDSIPALSTGTKADLSPSVGKERDRLQTPIKVGRVTAARKRASKAAQEEARLANLAAMSGVPSLLPSGEKEDVQVSDEGNLLFSGADLPGGLVEARVSSEILVSGFLGVNGKEGGETGGEKVEEGTGVSNEATVSLNDFPTTPSMADTYRQVTMGVIKDALGRTRARSARMGVVDLATLPCEATAWRNKNEELLKAIYGRTDLELQAVDVEMVERIGGLLKGVGKLEGYDWVEEVFRRAE